MSVGVRLLAVAERPEQRHQSEDDDRGTGERKPRAQLGPDVATVGIGEGEPKQHGADQEADRPAGGGHRSHQPTKTLEVTAAAKVSGAKRSAKRPPNVPAWSAMSFTSTIGPTTMKARRDVSENCVRLAATNASASEQIAISTVRKARASTESAPDSDTVSRTLRGIAVCSVAAVAAPTIRSPPAWSKSCWAVAAKTDSGRPSCVCPRRARSSNVSPPNRAQTSPTAIAASRLASSRAPTTSG